MRIVNKIFLCLLISIFTMMVFSEIKMPEASAKDLDRTEYTPISTKEELNAVRNDLSGKYYLTNDIVFSDTDFIIGGDFYNNGQGWIPFGSDLANPFCGIFDGNGFSIINLSLNINGNSNVYAGLFGFSKGAILNLGLENADISAKTGSYSSFVYAGGIVGFCSSGTVKNCYFQGKIHASSPKNSIAGGIVGMAFGSCDVRNCYNTGSINATSSDRAKAGGIVGSISGSSSCISNSFNMGSVATGDSENSCSGGIVGECSSAAVSNSYNVGIVSGRNSGGISGVLNSGTISDCYYLEYLSKGVGKGDNAGKMCSWDDLMKQETFIGFDFELIWVFNDSNQYPCPVLREFGAPVWNTNANTVEFAGGTGVPWDPFLIGTKEHLNRVRNDPNSYFKLINDIIFDDADFSLGGDYYNDGSGWEPIGNSAAHSFSGNFDGDGYVIQNLYININPSKDAYGGLFGYSTGKIKNLGMVNSDITVKTTDLSVDAFAGSIVGLSCNDVTNCYNTGTICGNSAGGIVGYLSSGTISKCYNSGTVVSDYEAGGIVGYSVGKIDECYSVGGVISSSTYAQIGGIAGSSNGETNYCYYLNSDYPGIGNGTDHCVGYTVSQMLQASSFSGFDFDTVWTMAGNSDYLYPELQKVKMQFTKKFVSIAVTALPTKTEYLEAKDVLDLSGGKLTVTYNNGMTEELNLSEVSVTGFDDTKIGEQTLTVSYNDVITTFKINVVAKSLDSIAITQNPAKQIYWKGESLDLSGMVVSAHYNNDTSELITDYTVEGDVATPGEKTITVSYKGKTTTFSVTVKEKSLVSIAITEKPKKLIYLEGDKFVKSGLVVTAYYDDTSSKKITEYTVSGYTSSPGTKIITVTYQDKTATFPVTVEAKRLTSIKVIKKPSKTTYLEGETFDPSGMVVKVYYNNDTSEEIIDYTVISDFSTPGIKLVTIAYGDKTVSLTVTVNPRVPSVITSDKYAIADGNLSKIPIGTPISTLLSNLNEGVFCKVYNGKTVLSQEIAVGTGMIIKLIDGTTVKHSVITVVTGDVNGDGVISITDLLLVKAHLLKKSTLSGVYSIAADTNGDGVVSITDFIQIKAQILKKGDIIAR